MAELDCDVLVIGGGLAGCWAALKAKEYAPNVILVDKGKVSRSGISSFAGAGICCPYPTDDLDDWQRELVKKDEYLADQDWIEILFQEQPKRIREMEEWGVAFERDEKGNLLRFAAMGRVITKVVTVSSEQLMGVMKERLQISGVNLLERVMITSLLTSDGICPTKGSIIGAYGFNTRSGESVSINAGATIICTGGSHFHDQTGDGIAQAYRAGAELWGMEFSDTFDDMGFDEYIGLHLISFERVGMRLYNSKGERFMLRYEPELAEMVDRRRLALPVIWEGLAGRGPIYADFTHLDKKGIELLRNLPTISMRVAAIEREGIDLSKERVKFNVFSGFIRVAGGIKHNIFSETSLAGLYVAGHAGMYPAHEPLAFCCVGGYRAGENAARYALELGRKQVKIEQIKDLEEETLRPLKANKGIKPQSLIDRVNKYLSPSTTSIFRNEKNIKAVLKECEGWEGDTTSLKAMDLHELVWAAKAKSIVDCVRPVFLSSLEREESRGDYIRVDYPFRDDVNWLKQVVTRRDEKGIRVRHFPIPIYRYKIKPQKYEKVPAKILFRLPGVTEGK